MSDISKWPFLWKLAPELEPPQRQDPTWWQKIEMIFGTEAAHEMLCALIRDRAVWWILEHHANSIMREGDEWIVAYKYCDGYRDMYGRNGDPTEALRLALCKALGVQP